MQHLRKLHICLPGEGQLATGRLMFLQTLLGDFIWFLNFWPKLEFLHRIFWDHHKVSGVHKLQGFVLVGNVFLCIKVLSQSSLLYVLLHVARLTYCLTEVTRNGSPGCPRLLFYSFSVQTLYLATLRGMHIYLLKAPNSQDEHLHRISQCITQSAVWWLQGSWQKKKSYALAFYKVPKGYHYHD